MERGEGERESGLRERWGGDEGDEERGGGRMKREKRVM